MKKDRACATYSSTHGQALSGKPARTNAGPASSFVSPMSLSLCELCGQSRGMDRKTTQTKWSPASLTSGASSHLQATEPLALSFRPPKCLLSSFYYKDNNLYDNLVMLSLTGLLTFSLMKVTILEIPLLTYTLIIYIWPYTVEEMLSIF